MHFFLYISSTIVYYFLIVHFIYLIYRPLYSVHNMKHVFLVVIVADFLQYIIIIVHLLIV